MSELTKRLEEDEEFRERIEKLKEKWNNAFPELSEQRGPLTEKKVLRGNERLDRQVGK